MTQSKSLKILRRLTPVVAYIILALAVTYSFVLERDHSNQNRHVLAVQTHSVLISGCHRSNDLRKTLQDILRASAKGAAKSSANNPQQAAEARIFFRVQIAKLDPINCAKAYPVPKG